MGKCMPIYILLRGQRLCADTFLIYYRLHNTHTETCASERCWDDERSKDLLYVSMCDDDDDGETKER